MKKITLLMTTAIFLGLTFNACGQIKHLVDRKNLKVIKANTRVTDNDINKYVGTWQYEKDGDQITIKLIKIIPNLGSDTSRIEVELLNGGFIYKKKGTVVLNTMDSKPIYGLYRNSNDESIITIRNKDGIKSTRFYISMIGKDNIILKLDEQPQEGFKVDDTYRFLNNVKLNRQ